LPPRLRNDRRPRPTRPGASANGNHAGRFGRALLLSPAARTSAATADGVTGLSAPAGTADSAEAPPAAGAAAPEAPQQRPSWTERLDGLRAGRSWPAWIGSVLTRHWLAAILLIAGLVMRILAQLAYSPAILYIDSVKYLYNGWEGTDPVGYRFLLKPLADLGGLASVTAFQHLCGLGMAVLIYALLLRRGANRYLAALAMAPILLDGYQLQAEQTIMPDVLFEAMLVVAFVVFLWRETATWRTVIITGLVLGCAVTVREVGLISIAPPLLYLVVAKREDWLDIFGKCVAIIVAFVVPIFLYGAYSLDTTHHLLSEKGSTAGRFAEAVDCKTIKLPPAVRPMCPTPAEQKESPDWLEHSPYSPLIKGIKPSERPILVSEFDHAVEKQQPVRVAESILRDAIRLFEIDRTDIAATTPIWRWQFQTHFPTFKREVFVRPDGTIVLGYQVHFSSPWHYYQLPTAWGGKAKINKPLASFLRSYQLNGGFTPGPLLLAFTILGLIGSVLALVRKWNSPRGRQIALASGFFFAAALGLLLVADLYVFSWRYQLMALITLPPAGALGFAALTDLFRRRGSAGDGPAAIKSSAVDSGAADAGASVA
jgi:hypothetical protein